MDQPFTNFAEICSHFVPCIYILVYRNNLQLQGNTLIQTLMVESSPRGMDQADIRSIPTSNQWTGQGHVYWTLQTAETSHGEDQLIKYCLSLLHYGNQFDQHFKC